MVGFHFMDEEICKEMLSPHPQVHRVIMILLEPEINSRTLLGVGVYAPLGVVACLTLPS